ncbi:rhamnosyltransferase, partial [Escherichia coli]|nr:rhamnosyltransferase [Escherichia coli]
MCSLKVSALLVSYNPDINRLSEVLNSIHSQVDHLVLVDNGSKNKNDILALIADYEGVYTLLNDNNIGLASAQNVGIDYIIDNNLSDFIVFFDQDSVLQSGFISALLETYTNLVTQNIKLAAVGPSFIDPVNNKQYPATVYAGPFIKRVDLERKPVEATFIIASGCFVAIEALKKIGKMKDELFIDYIDVEWCLRARSLGYKIYISPKAVMKHTIGDNRVSIFGRTISVHSPLRRYYLVRNSFYMIRLDYIPIGYKIREIFFNVVRICISLALSDDKK